MLSVEVNVGVNMEDIKLELGLWILLLERGLKSIFIVSNINGWKSRVDLNLELVDGVNYLVIGLNMLR